MLLYYFSPTEPAPFSQNQTVLARLRGAVSRGFAPVVLFTDVQACDLSAVNAVDKNNKWNVGLLVGYGKKAGAEEWLVWTPGTDEFKHFKVGANEYCSEMVAMYQVPSGYDNKTLSHSKQAERKYFDAEKCDHYIVPNVCLYNCPQQYRQNYVNNGQCSYSCLTKYFVRDDNFEQYNCVDACPGGYYYVYRAE